MIHKLNGGLSDARNAALEVCTGDYIAFMDSDDWIEPQMYSDMMTMMLEQRLEMVLCTAREIIDGELAGARYRYFSDGTVMDASEVQKLALKAEIAAAVWMRLCRKECFEQVRFPVGRNYEDIAVTFLPFEHAEKVGFLDRPLYNYRINKNGIAHQKKPLTRYQMFLSYRDCFDYALRNMPEVAPEVCTLKNNEQLRQIQPEVEQFLRDHRSRVFKSDNKFIKILMLAYFYCKPMLKILYKLSYPFLKLRWK